jgi:hypothetical protein
MINFTRSHPHSRQSVTRKAACAFAAIVSLLAFSGKSQAQIIWSVPQSITGASNVSTLGTLFDAIEADTGDTTSQMVNGTTFNALHGSLTDGKITLSFNLAAGGTAGAGSGGSASTASTAYNAVLTGNEYVSKMGSQGIITLGKTGNLLVAGDTYQVEVWDASYESILSAGTGGVGTATATTELNNQFVLGTFVAGSSGIESFTWTPPTNTYGSLSAVSVRDITDIPEPSTYAMMLSGFGLLVLLARRKLA